MPGYITVEATFIVVYGEKKIDVKVTGFDQFKGTVDLTFAASSNGATQPSLSLYSDHVYIDASSGPDWETKRVDLTEGTGTHYFLVEAEPANGEGDLFQLGPWP